MREPYPATLCAAVHTGNPGDVDFYTRACHGVDPVLELGCGTGRIGAALVTHGHEVYGIDIDPEALSMASQRDIVTVEADMRDFRIRRRFARILIPYNGLYCLLDDEDVVACFNSARRHLAPSGQLLLDGYPGDFIDEAYADEAQSRNLHRVARVVADNAQWDVHERSRWDVERQIIDAEYVHVATDGGKTVRATIRQRYLTSQQFPALLHQAQLAIASLQGGFADEPFEPECELMVIRAERW